MKKIIIFWFLISCSVCFLDSVEIKHSRNFYLKEKNNIFIQAPTSFFVTEDDMLFIFDAKASNIKIFDENGNLFKTFGRKGMGPDEFIYPRYGVYKKPFIAILDFGRRHFFIYERTGKSDLTFKKKFLCVELAEDICINDSNILVAGYKKNNKGEPFNLYIYDYKFNNYNFILSEALSYGYTTKNYSKGKFLNKICYIGLNAFCDWTDDNIYYAWTADLKITKFNCKTRKLIAFGEKSENYIQPIVSPELKKAYETRKAKLCRQLKRSKSYIRKVFSNRKIVGVVYAGNKKKNQDMIVVLQIYKPSGEFVMESIVLKSKVNDFFNELFFYFRKDKNLFYIMETETDKDFNQIFKIHEYLIAE